MYRRRSVHALTVALSLVAAACSNDDAPADDTSEGSGDADTAAPDDATDDTEGSADVPPPPLTCGDGSDVELAGCVEEARIREDVAFIAKPRPVGSAHWQAVQDQCATRLASLGYTVERMPYGGGVNVIGTKLGTTRPDELVVVSAHYDHIETLDAQGRLCPGADDNASGVASLYETARVLAERDNARTLVFACWDEEERGLLGSRAWAEQAAAAGSKVVVGITLETMAYTSGEPESQQLPDGFALFFADAVRELRGRQNRGDFIAAIGSASAQATLDDLRELGSLTGAHVIPLPLGQEFLQAQALADLRRSDHAPFWDQGYPALMLTDTANFRNPHYHCLNGFDEVDTLDYPFLADVTANVVGAVVRALDDLERVAATPHAPACSPLEQDCADGQRCSLRSNDVSVWSPVCNDALGEAQPLDTCSRPTNEPGVDDCDHGSFCALFGVPQPTPGSTARRCLPFCRTSDACPEGTDCLRVLNMPLLGMCAASCDPLEADPCGAGTRCTAVHGMTTPGVAFFCTDFAVPGEPVGASCTSTAQCAHGTGCLAEPGICRPWCDVTTPCASGRCEPYPQPAGRPGLGLCRE